MKKERECGIRTPLPDPDLHVNVTITKKFLQMLEVLPTNCQLVPTKIGN